MPPAECVTFGGKDFTTAAQIFSAISYTKTLNERHRSSESRLPRRPISAHAGSDLSDFILGERRMAPFTICDEQCGLDFFGAHTAPAHRPGQASQCVVALVFRDGAAYRRAPVRAWFLRLPQQPQEPLRRLRDRRAVPPAAPVLRQNLIRL